MYCCTNELPPSAFARQQLAEPHQRNKIVWPPYNLVLHRCDQSAWQEKRTICAAAGLLRQDDVLEGQEDLTFVLETRGIGMSG